MTVLIISYSFPPCTTGAATLMYNLCKYLPKEWYIVVTAHEDLGVLGNLGACDERYTLDCNIIRLPVRTYKIVDRIKFLLFTVLQGLMLSRKGDLYCLLAVYPNEFNLFGAYILHKLTAKPLIVYMHDLYSETRKKASLYKLWRSCEKKIFDSASLILVTNEKFEEYYRKRKIKRVRVLHSCVDPYLMHFTDTKKTVSRKLKVVYTGSVYRATEDSIIAFLETIKKMDDVEVVFSTPHERGYLKKISIGFLPKKKCYELQRNADVLFLPLSFDPSLIEEIQCAFPIKILEYLAAKKPILAVVPKGSYIEYFIKKYKVGIAVTELSEKKIANAINKLKDEKTRNFFSKNASKIVCFYNAKIHATKLRSIVDKIILSNQK